MSPDPWRIARYLAAGAFAFNMIAVGLVWWSGEQSRQENCRHVSEAFDVYTDALIAASQNPDRSPEEQAAADAKAAAFRATIHDALDDCS